MRMYRAAIAFVALAAVAGCDTAISNRVASIAGTTNNGNGRAALTVSPGTLNLAVGSTFQLSTNAPVALQPLVQWSSLNQAVASVSPAGSVLGQAVGTTRILARYSDDTTNVGSATVTVVGTGNTGDRMP